MVLCTSSLSVCGCEVVFKLLVVLYRVIESDIRILQAMRLKMVTLMEGSFIYSYQEYINFIVEAQDT